MEPILEIIVQVALITEAIFVFIIFWSMEINLKFTGSLWHKLSDK